MSNDVKLPERLEWGPCPCEQSSCKREYPTNLGTYYLGSGFDPDEKAALDDAWNARHQPQREAVLEDCDIAWLWKVHTDAQSKGLHADQRKIERILAALTTPAPPSEREAVLEIRAAVFEAVKAHHAAPALLRRDMLDDTLTKATHRILAALTTPAPAEDDDPDDHLGGKLAAAVERELDRIEQRNSTRQDFTPAFDRELARKVIMAGFGLFSCRGGTTASGYQWSGLLETLGLNKARPVSTAPAVSTDAPDQALLTDIFDKMAEVVAPLPGEE